MGSYRVDFVPFRLLDQVQQDPIMISLLTNRTSFIYFPLGLLAIFLLLLIMKSGQAI